MRSITLKITLAFLAVSLTGIALVAILVWGITLTEFNRFVVDRALSDFVTSATSYYQETGSWDGFTESAAMDRKIPVAPLPNPEVNSQLNSGPNAQPIGENPHPQSFILTDADGKVILSAGPYLVGETIPQEILNKGSKITVNGQTVGIAINSGRPPSPNPLEERFFARASQSFYVAALGVAVIAILLGLFLARTITRPIRELTIATSAMANGHFNQQVQVRSKDELGELTRSFNKMSTDLEHSNYLRRQMTADIAHDLRTPLSVITGYLEGLKDGVLKPTTTRFEAMYNEALFLQRLIEDLRTLSLADAGELSINRQPTPPSEIIERLENSFSHQAEHSHIQLKSCVAPNLPSIQVDAERMQQALGNLVSNAIRFTPDGGSITLSAGKQDERVYLQVKDSGLGISEDTLPHIFERFYKGESSRHEEGSGLGLAITKSIIELQNGQIEAASKGENQGTEFTIWLFPSS